MSALNDDIDVTGIVVHIVLLSILTDGCSNLVLHRCCDCVLTCVHVCDLCVNEALRKLLPRLVLDVVIFSDVQTPDLARSLLEDSEEMKNLPIPHPFIEILIASHYN